MALDTSIYFQNQKNVELMNPYDAAIKGQNLRSLTMQNDRTNAENLKALKDIEDQKTLSDMLRKNVVVDEKGNATLNKGAALSDLYKYNPAKAMEFQKQFDQLDLEKQKFVTETSKNLAWSATPENWQQTKMQAIKMGLPNAEKLPDMYSPEFSQRWQMATLAGEKQLENKMAMLKETNDQSYKDKDLALKAQHYRQLEKQNAFDNMIKVKTLENSEGQKTVDKEFAKDYNEWTSGGAKVARSEIDKLKNVINELERGKLSTGGLTGVLTDRLTSNKLLQARSDVQSTVMNSLRSIVGASFTEKEGERVIKNTWNESDSTENNIARLRRLVGDLENKANDKDSKSSYFETTGGTLKGFKAEPNKQESKSSNANLDPEVAAAFKWAKENPNDPRAKEIMKRIGG